MERGYGTWLAYYDYSNNDYWRAAILNASVNIHVDLLITSIYNVTLLLTAWTKVDRPASSSFLLNSSLVWKYELVPDLHGLGRQVIKFKFFTHHNELYLWFVFLLLLLLYGDYTAHTDSFHPVKLKIISMLKLVSHDANE